jgi:hypothetical protein
MSSLPASNSTEEEPVTAGAAAAKDAKRAEIMAKLAAAKVEQKKLTDQRTAFYGTHEGISCEIEDFANITLMSCVLLMSYLGPGVGFPGVNPNPS